MPAMTTPLRSPAAFEGPWSAVEAAAIEAGAPLLVPLAPFADDRGYSIMNLFAGAMSAEGQVNYSVQYPGVVKAWHRHRHQSDFWCCVSGHLKVGVHREGDPRGDALWLAIIGDRRPAAVVIPPTLWHGAAACGPEPAGLLYYVTRQYQPSAPDEERRAWDAVDHFPWGVRHR